MAEELLWPRGGTWPRWLRELGHYNGHVVASLAMSYHQIEALMKGAVNMVLATSTERYAGSRVHAPHENIRLEDFMLNIKLIAVLLAEFAEY